MKDKMKGYFKLLQKTSFKDILDGKSTTVPESDLCFQNNESILQYEFVEPEEDPKHEIKPGIYTMIGTSSSVRLAKTELKQQNLLEMATNTQAIMSEAKMFFNGLSIYEELDRPKKRGVLIYSSPGLGKSSAINKVCRKLVDEDPGTVVLIWPTSSVEAENVATFFSTGSTYEAKCTKVVLIIEDIGGTERETSDRAVNADLLNLLDGVGVTFQLPTFILATTNHPEHLLESLADRPERFDLMIELLPPKFAERIKLTEFIAKRSLTEEEKNSLNVKGAEGFSIAHLVEVVVRSKLHNKSIPKVVQELIDHTKRFQKGFSNRSSVGINQ